MPYRLPPTLDELRVTDEPWIPTGEHFRTTNEHITNCGLCKREGFTLEYKMLSLARMLRKFYGSLKERNSLDSIE